METRWDEVALLLPLLIAAGCNIETPIMGDEHPQSDVNYNVTDRV